ncbi:MAG: sigma-54 dependent transcriptional regulator [Tannerella sp.]|jgi:DNA-binding NtrC family response regulator|nr:sigma-54 dependent transcriptional regulator [Tannerella sp.]
MEKKGKILIIDDNEDILLALNMLLQTYFEKIKVSTSPEKIKYYQRTFQPDLILLDMNFHKDVVSGQEGFYWLKKILENDPEAVVIFMTAYANVDKAIQAIKAGATDFVSKPWEKEKLLATLSAALKLSKSREEIENLKAQLQTLNKPTPIKVIGKSKAMLEVFETIEKLSQTEANLLILGENGTGKDLIANAIYLNSPRKDKLFTMIDLGVVPEALFESELFGYEKGAFTDARKNKAGRMEIASGGTLFMNEIGNLSLSMQAKLLTAIEKKEIFRLGSTHALSIDVRYICATNSDIYNAVYQGEFRQDLLYRINTIEIRMPPLRERGEDIFLLAEHFLKQFAHKYRKNIDNFSEDAKNKLKTYHWPGNVRELQNIIERAVILSSDNILKGNCIIIQSNERRQELENLNLEEMERKIIEKALLRTGGNMNKAAELLGITRFSLYRKLKNEE